MTHYLTVTADDDDALDDVLNTLASAGYSRGAGNVAIVSDDDDEDAP